MSRWSIAHRLHVPQTQVVHLQLREYGSLQGVALVLLPHCSQTLSHSKVSAEQVCAVEECRDGHLGDLVDIADRHQPMTLQVIVGP